MPARSYIKGLRIELAQRGIEVPDTRLFFAENCTHSTKLTGAREWDDLMDLVTGRLLDGPDRATGIFCGDDYVSERVYLAAMDRGLRVPEDLSIIGFGPTWRDGTLRARLASVTLDEVELGRRAVRVLDEMRTGRRPLDSNEVITLPVELLKGQSLGPPPESRC